MLGMIDLGLNISWRFDFIEYGSQCHSQIGTIYADVGGVIDLGVVDHHLKDNCFYDSTVSVIANNPNFILDHLLKPLNDTYYKGLEIVNKNFIFAYVTHRNPDWDGMAAFYLCNYLAKYGKLPAQNITIALCHATDLIDQGKARLDGELLRPHIVYNTMSSICKDWNELLWQGHQLIDDIIASNQKMSRSGFLEPISSQDKYAREISEINSDKHLFDEDLSASSSVDLYIPSRDETLAPAKALYFNKTPQSKMAKYWARETTDFQVLIVPYGKDGVFNRFVISTDPHSGYSLPCLGYELERAETEKRAKIGKTRKGNPRFEPEYCNNSDPWYDGRSHGFTIIDSPSQGTVLMYEDVLDIIKALYGSKERKQPSGKSYDAFISYRRTGGTDIAWALKVMLEKHGRKVFLDYASLKAGMFDTQLLESVKKAKSLILILSPGSLDRCRNEDDWLRCEIRTAIAHGVKILPLLKDGFNYEDLNNVPDDISSLKNCQSLTMNYEYFYAVLEKLNQYIDMPSEHS